MARQPVYLPDRTWTNVVKKCSQGYRAKFQSLETAVCLNNSPDILETKLATYFPIGIIDQSEATFSESFKVFFNTMRIMVFVDSKKSKAKAYLRTITRIRTVPNSYEVWRMFMQAFTSFKISFFFVLLKKKKSQSMYCYASKSQHLLLDVITTSANRCLWKVT